jgi:hypothetical protein
MGSSPTALGDEPADLKETSRFLGLSLGPALLMAIALLWVLFVFGGYYAVHKPVTPDQAQAILRLAGQILSGLALAGLAGGTGRRLFRAPGLETLERSAVEAALGFGLLGLGWMGLGLLGGYSILAAWTCLALGWTLLWRENLAWFSQFRALAALWQSTGRFGKTLGALAACLAGIQLFYALAPPVKWDALMYHLELPRRYLAAGAFQFLTWNPYWGQPQLAEMLYTWGQALAGAETAALTGWLFHFILLAGILGTGARLAGATGGWLAVAALLAGATFRGLMGAAYADGLAALFGYAVLACALAWAGRRSTAAQDGAGQITRPHSTLPLLLWSGILAGFAILSKLTAGVALIALVGTILWKQGADRIALIAHRISHIADRRSPIANPNSQSADLESQFLIRNSPLATRHLQFLIPDSQLAAAVLLLAGLVVSPYLLANTLFTGNPLYPHFWATDWSGPERLAYFRSAGPSAGAQLLWLPLAITWFGIDTNAVSGMVAYAADLGPLLAALALPGILFRRAGAARRILGLWLAAGWAAMALGGSYSPLLWQARLYFALLPAAALAAALGWAALARVRAGSVRLSRLTAALVLLVMGLGLAQEAYSLARLNPAGALAGKAGRQAYLERALGGYPAAMEAVAGLAPEARTLFLWEPRGLYAPLAAQPDSWIDRWYLERRAGRNPAAILARWRDQGFTHLLIFRAGADFERHNRPQLHPADWQALDALLAMLPPPELPGADYDLYRLAP